MTYSSYSQLLQLGLEFQPSSQCWGPIPQMGELRKEFWIVDPMMDMLHDSLDLEKKENQERKEEG